MTIPPISRRGLLTAGALSCLGSQNLSGLLATPPNTQSKSPPRSAIVVFLAGGLSPLDSLDPKPDAPVEIRGEFGSIATATPGIRLSDQLPQLARRLNRFTLVRSMAHSQGDHRLAERQALSGERFTSVDTPSIGSVVAHQVGWQVPPAYTAIPRQPSDAGVLGPACNAFSVLGDGGQLLAQSPRKQRRNGRRALLRLLDEGSAAGATANSSELTRDEAYQQSLELLSSQAFRDTINAELEPAAVRERYGEHELGHHLLLARRLVEAGSRFVLVPVPGWDTHRDNFTSLRSQLPPLDNALSALIDDLADRDRLDSTAVLVLSEFGRTPRVNRYSGRDHWPRAMTAIWCGGADSGGRTLGATDPKGQAPRSNSISPGDLAATVLAHVGIHARGVALPPAGRLLLPDTKLITSLVAPVPMTPGNTR